MAAVSRDRKILVIIDPQNDFCAPGGALYVPGADGDMARLASHLRERGSGYTDIYISLDSHDNVSIFHPLYWADAEGRHPEPYTLITQQDFLSGAWRPSAQNKIFTKRTFDLMARGGTYGVMIWPEHCIVSTRGHQIVDCVLDALDEWRRATGGSVRYIFKGESPYAEQFSIFDNIDGTWGDSRMCEDMFARFALAKSITFAGEALSHCVEISIASYIDRVRGSRAYDGQEVRLLSDCTSPVSGFDRAASEDRIAQLGVVLKSTQTSWT